MYKSFQPPNRILMGPGPSNVHPRVLEALSKPTLGHLDPKFIELMDEIKELLKYTFKTESDSTFVLSGPGSLGMEACLVNLVEPGMKVAVCISGYFGNRMKQIIEKIGAIPIVVNEKWGRAVDPQKLEDTLKANPDVKVAAFVHAETSTGVLQDIKTLSDIAHKYDCLVVADTVTSLGAVEVRVDEWQLDAVYSCSQKGLSCVAGMSPVTFSERAISHIKNRKTPIQSWFNDLNLLMSYWGNNPKRAYHHTAPANHFYGIHEALSILKEEGIENSWRRHKENSAKFIQRLSELTTTCKKINLEPLVPEGERIPNLIAVKVPEGVDEAKVRTELLQKHNLEIGAGLGELTGKIWRIGLMGYNSNEKMIDYCIGSLKDVLS
ncbi:alanine--glyoxylate aminotransferase family protein [Melioribacteraceae bacterium 4301-Me]|uniref:pyridoxal-phosphate-dependent aminotransferase family protein n=1 Tax=Pyranulibacter aquaticus TaxID=3163344 RepID=UPI003597472F